MLHSFEFLCHVEKIPVLDPARGESRPIITPSIDFSISFPSVSKFTKSCLPLELFKHYCCDNIEGDVVGGTCGAYSKRLAVRAQFCLSKLVVDQINMAENRYVDAVL